MRNPFTRNRRAQPITEAVADRSFARDTHIASYLRANQINALVRRNGEIIHDGTTHQQLLTGLGRLAQHRYGVTAVLNLVSPIELRELQDAEKRKTGQEQEETLHKNNATVEYVLSKAIEAGASDIYLDIRRDVAILSFRVYGVIQQINELDIEVARGIARSMWNQGSAQWVESEPSDVAFTYTHESKKYRVRGSSLQDTRGNSIACRVRDPNLILPLNVCGYSDHQVSLIQRICRAPGGMILISGETNSGKSTTLATLISDSSRSQRMIEIADPCEVEFEHCTHVEIDHYRENATEVFQGILGATVRHNPDALVLGEIRDEITAQAAQNMAIQGKRVYSTLHTQSCVAAIPRLANLGIDRHLLSLREFIAGIVNQNLVPLVCQNCSRDRHDDAGKDRRYRALFGPDIRYINPDGCNECVSGVAGQTLVAEVYPFFLDRKDAHKFISNHELFRLETYMKREFNIESKEDHARSKVHLGLIDPGKTEEIIGEWSDGISHDHPVMNIQPAEARNAVG